MTINEWCRATTSCARDHGFVYDGNLLVPLMLIVTEAAEAAEAWRKGDDAHVPEELADIVIRTFNLAGALGIDLEGAIEAKHAHNLTRPFMHGGKRA